MEKEITFTYNVEKPFTENEINDFKKFKSDLKSLLKKGKVKVTEKFKVFTFSIFDYTIDEKNNILVFLKKSNQTINVI